MHHLILAGLVSMLATLVVTTAAGDTKRYLSHTPLCDGRAEFIELSDMITINMCADGIQYDYCSAEVYRYRVRCTDGRQFSAPELFAAARKVTTPPIRVDNNVLVLQIGTHPFRCSPPTAPNCPPRTASSAEPVLFRLPA